MKHPFLNATAYHRLPFTFDRNISFSIVHSLITSSSSNRKDKSTGSTINDSPIKKHDSSPSPSPQKEAIASSKISKRPRIVSSSSEDEVTASKQK